MAAVFQKKAKNFLALRRSTLMIFLAFSAVVGLFFADPFTFLFPAALIGGLYYYAMLYLFSGIGQIIGFEYYQPNLFSDTFFTVFVGTTVIGYVYILACYISHVARHASESRMLPMALSLGLIFAFPFIIPIIAQHFQPTYATPPAHNVVDEESCTSLPLQSGLMGWREAERTCYMEGTFASNGPSTVGIGKDVTLQITPGGNFTFTRFVNNNGTIAINGGIMRIVEGYLYNNGVIYHNSGTFINDGFIEANRYFDGEEVRLTTTQAMFVNRATFENNNYLYGHGSLVNWGVMENRGIMQLFDDSAVDNKGTVKNFGRIEVAGTVSNEGRVQNAGELVIYEHLTYDIPGEDPTVVNNQGSIINLAGGKIYNNSMIHNRGTISNEIGEIHNEGAMRNYCNAEIEGQVDRIAPVLVCSGNTTD